MLIKLQGPQWSRVSHCTAMIALCKLLNKCLNFIIVLLLSYSKHNGRQPLSLCTAHQQTPWYSLWCLERSHVQAMLKTRKKVLLTRLLACRVKSALPRDGIFRGKLWKKNSEQLLVRLRYAGHYSCPVNLPIKTFSPAGSWVYDVGQGRSRLASWPMQLWRLFHTTCFPIFFCNTVPV